MFNSTKYILFLLNFALLFACKNPPVSDQIEPVLSEQYAPLLDTLNNYVIGNKISGGVGLVYEKGEIAFHKSFGYNEIDKKEEQKLSDIFRIASMTKPITSVAAMTLYEKKKFELDDPISKYLPEFSNPEILLNIDKTDSSYTSVAALNEITIRHLFTFSSGLYYGFDNDSLAILFSKAGISEGFEERNITLEENIRKLAKLPLLHEPGERYHYGLEMDVLGRLIEVWSEMSLDEYFQKEIFKPLGMNDTYFYLPEEKYDRLVNVYSNQESGLVKTDYNLIDYPKSGAKTYFSGGADLSSTAFDYYLFCRMMLNKGELNGTRILKPETVELMSSTHLETGDNDMGLGFGLLSAKTNSELSRSVGSISWGGFFTTTFWIDPVEEIIGILMLQMYPFRYWGIMQAFEDEIYRIKQ